MRKVAYISNIALLQTTDANADVAAREAAGYSSEGEEYHRSRQEEIFDEEESDEVIHENKSAAPSLQRPWRVENTSNSNDMYLTELSSLQLLIARQVAALSLHPLIEKYYTLNKLLAIVDSHKKKTMWSRMLGVMAVPKKQKGIALFNNRWDSRETFRCPGSRKWH